MSLRTEFTLRTAAEMAAEEDMVRARVRATGAEDAEWLLAVIGL